MRGSSIEKRTRYQVKQKDKSIRTMKEVSGPDGPETGFIIWTVKEMIEAMAHLSNPVDSSHKFSTELITFCQEFSPTVQELRRLLFIKMGATNWQKVSAKLPTPTEDFWRVHIDWDDASNRLHRIAVNDIANAIKAAFPLRVDIEKLISCCQNGEESVQDYYNRLYETFNMYGGLPEPENRGNQPGTWECFLQMYFLKGLKKEIAQAVKSSYIDWSTGRLATVLAHALHAEEQQMAKKEQQGIAAGLSASSSFVPPPQQTGARRGRGGGFSNRAGGNSVRLGYWICGTEDHTVRDCARCKRCKKKGHWALNCPDKQKAY